MHSRERAAYNGNRICTAATVYVLALPPISPFLDTGVIGTLDLVAEPFDLADLLADPFGRLLGGVFHVVFGAFVAVFHLADLGEDVISQISKTRLSAD